MPYKNFTSEVLTSNDVDTYLMRQSVMTFASDAARDSALSGVAVGGMVCYTEDNDRLYYLKETGGDWVVLSEAPQTWNVTSITQSGSVSCTTTAGTGWYQRHNGVFHAAIEIAATASGTSSNPIIVPTPLTLSNLRNVHGTYLFLDASDSFRAFSGVVSQASTTTLGLAASGDAGSASGLQLGNAGFTAAIASGDVIRLGLTGRY